MQVSAHVHLVGGPDLSDPKDALTYAAAGTKAVVLIDSGAGPSAGRIIRNVEQACGRAPTHLILTHAHIDHAGGAAWIREHTGSRVWIHRAEAKILETGDRVRSAADWYGLDLEPVKADRLLQGGEILDLGQGLELNLIHTPGHTPGSISIWLDDQGRRVLLGQDIHGPFLPEFGSDKALWARSMKKLLALEADILGEGHFGVFQGAEEVRAFILDQLGGRKKGAPGLRN